MLRADGRLGRPLRVHNQPIKLSRRSQGCICLLSFLRPRQKRSQAAGELLAAVQGVSR